METEFIGRQESTVALHPDYEARHRTQDPHWAVAIVVIGFALLALTAAGFIYLWVVS